ncbi:hypothetical protein FHW92_004911 [Novosphingobium sp. SG707]|nr:hypothetical protein [Novosphingobium sp. SG707]
MIGQRESANEDNEMAVPTPPSADTAKCDPDGSIGHA